MATRGGRWERNFLAAGKADGKIASERVHGFLKRLALVLAIRCNVWQIHEFNHYAAVTAGRKLSGIRKCKHRAPSHNSCGSIFKSREPALEFRTFHNAMVGQFCPRVKRVPP